jgi:hypothetical protein
MTSAVTLAQSASAGNTLNFKNRLINGDFEIWQRGTGPTYLTSGLYQADRWTCMGFQAARHQRVSVTSPVAGMTARFANRVGSSTVAENGGGTRMTCDQKIESINCYDLAGRTVTYSFWIRFSSATAASVANSVNSAFGNFNSYIAGSTTNTDSATSPDSIGTVVGVNVITNGSLPTTWTKITGTTTVPVGSNNVALRLGFGALGSTTNPGDVWYEVTECQVELGSIATAFDRRPYSLEEMLCQRYFQWNARQNLFGRDSGSVVFNHVCPVPMRATPTVSLTSTSPYYENNSWSSVGTLTGAAVSNGHMTPLGGDVLITGNFAGTALGAGAANGNFGGNQIRFEAEL